MSGIEENTHATFGPKRLNRLELMGIRFADEGGDGSGAGDNAGQDNYTPPATQADFDRIIGERLGRVREQFKDYDALKTKAEQFDQIKANGTPGQDPSLAARLAEFESRVTTSEQNAASTRTDLETTKLELTRKDVLLDKGLSKEDLVLLTGTTREELEAAADRVLALKGATSSGRVPGQGGRDNATTTGGSVDAGRELFEKRKK